MVEHDNYSEMIDWICKCLRHECIKKIMIGQIQKNDLNMIHENKTNMNVSMILCGHSFVTNVSSWFLRRWRRC